MGESKRRQRLDPTFGKVPTWVRTTLQSLKKTYVSRHAKSGRNATLVSELLSNEPVITLSEDIDVLPEESFLLPLRLQLKPVLESYNPDCEAILIELTGRMDQQLQFQIKRLSFDPKDVPSDRLCADPIYTCWNRPAVTATSLWFSVSVGKAVAIDAAIIQHFKQQEKAKQQAGKPLRQPVAVSANGSGSSLFPVRQSDDPAWEMENEWHTVQLPDLPPRKLIFIAGTVPATPQHFYHQFDSQWIEECVLEYWATHNFNWSSHQYPVLRDNTRSLPLCHQELPGDMATALSLQRFNEGCGNLFDPSEQNCRAYCIVVCGLGKAMQMIAAKWRSLTASQLYQAALQITHCVSVSEAVAADN